MSLIIYNAALLDGDGHLSNHDIVVENGIIQKIVVAGTLELSSTTENTIVDAKGMLVAPGFIDMHVHLREPGFEHKETIETGARSAAKGGFTTIACMPNTNPITDSPEVVELVKSKAKEADLVHVLPYAAITKGEKGQELTDFAALKQAGVVGFTDDGVGVQNAQMMKDAMALAKSLDMPVIAHCEDNSLVVGAPVNEGTFAQKHGLKGIPNESEAIHVGRDILLSEATGAHYHVCHVSTEQSVRLIRLAKSIGIRVTTEICPHHLLLSEEDIPGLDTNWKMNPPLRSKRDVEACIEALEDGTIDMIVTDHAPHSQEEKAKGMLEAPFGIVGFETAFPLLYTKFVLTGRWSLSFLISRMTSDPAKVFGLDAGVIEVGAPADITIVDLNKTKAVNPEEFATKGRNTPFGGWELTGWPVTTIVSGKIVWSE